MELYAATNKYRTLGGEYGAEFECFGLGVRFYFHAENQRDADKKIIKWNRYHGFLDKVGYGWHIAVRADKAPNSSWIHDEYVS